MNIEQISQRTSGKADFDEKSQKLDLCCVKSVVNSTYVRFYTFIAISLTATTHCACLRISQTQRQKPPPIRLFEAYEEPIALWILNNTHSTLFIKLLECFSRDQFCQPLLQQCSNQLRNQKSQLWDQGIT